jgi:hypothetical protein
MPRRVIVMTLRRPIDRIGAPLDQPPVDEVVDGGDHVAAVDAGVPSELGLARRAVLVQGGE